MAEENPAHDPSLPASGTVIDGKLRVGEPIGSGGMGHVVQAEHLLLGTSVAIKFLHRIKEGSSVRRFIQEAQTAQGLTSDHVVRVYDLGVHEGAPYIVMELLEGEDLACVVENRSRLSLADAVDSILEASVAVAEAHAANIVHRDIKPANLFDVRTRTGKRLIKVLDFGISKVTQAHETGESTGDGALLGSPQYMSPEQLRNPARVDGRTDLWALGVTLYHLLTGAHPFHGDTASEIAAAVIADPPSDLRQARPGLPEEFYDVMDGLLQKRPEDRTASIADLARRLLPFAGRRGALAVERILLFDAPAAPVEPHGSESSPGRSKLAGTTTIAASLALPRETRSTRWVALALSALAIGVAAYWLGGGLRGGAVASQDDAASSRIPSAATPEVEPAPEKPAATPPTPEPTAPLEQVAPAPPAPERRSVPPRSIVRAPEVTPPTPASVAPPKATVPVDEDGVPIIR